MRIAHEKATSVRRARGCFNVVHYEIGYTDFIHLLPAWFAFALYVAGLILLYPYMHGIDRGACTNGEIQASP